MKMVLILAQATMSVLSSNPLIRYYLLGQRTAALTLKIKIDTLKLKCRGTLMLYHKLHEKKKLLPAFSK